MEIDEEVARRFWAVGHRARWCAASTRVARLPRLRERDVIVAANGERVSEIGDLRQALRRKGVGPPCR